MTDGLLGVTKFALTASATVAGMKGNGYIHTFRA